MLAKGLGLRFFVVPIGSGLSRMTGHMFSSPLASLPSSRAHAFFPPSTLNLSLGGTPNTPASEGFALPGHSQIEDVNRALTVQGSVAIGHAYPGA